MLPHPSPSSSSYSSHEPPPRAQLWWDRLPSLKIVRPPKGPFSPQVDERCFTYCSQSITGRIHGNDPTCRTICFRRVFRHEVVRILAHPHIRNVKHIPGRPPTVEVEATTPANHPLPPEGQRYSGWLDMLLRDRSPDGEDAHEGDTMHSRSHSQRDAKHWQEGWYLWWSSSRWAAQEKLDLMRRDLEGQTEWQNLKDKRNEEWARGIPPPGEGHGEEQPQMDVHPFEDLGNMPPFPEVTSSSILLPLPLPPTSFTDLAASLGPVLAPTGHVLALVNESIRSGAQREFWGRAWKTAQSDEPRKLLVFAWERAMENLVGKEEEGSGSGSGGGSGSGDGGSSKAGSGGASGGVGASGKDGSGKDEKR